MFLVLPLSAISQSSTKKDGEGKHKILMYDYTDIRDSVCITVQPNELYEYGWSFGHIFQKN